MVFWLFQNYSFFRLTKDFLYYDILIVKNKMY